MNGRDEVAGVTQHRRGFLAAAGSLLVGTSGCTGWLSSAEPDSDIMNDELPSARVSSMIDEPGRGWLKVSIHQPMLLSTISPVETDPGGDADMKDVYDPMELDEGEAVLFYDRLTFSRYDDEFDSPEMILPPLSAWSLTYGDADGSTTVDPLQEKVGDVAGYVYRQVEGQYNGQRGYSERAEHSENSLAFVVSEDALGCTLKYEPWRIDRNHEYEWPRNQGLEFTVDFRDDGE